MESGHTHQDKKATCDLNRCAYCGSSILRGAMRCVSCGKILKTPEEQSAAIRNMVKGQQRMMIRRVIRLAVAFIASGAAYYFYADRVQEFILKLLNR